MKILIVEDNEEVRATLVENLMDEKRTIFEAENGKSALDFLENHCVDLVITDVQMPVMDGMQLLREIKLKYGKLPIVIIVTGFSKYRAANFYNEGANGYFEKPLDFQKFIDHIETYQNKLFKKL